MESESTGGRAHCIHDTKRFEMAIQDSKIVRIRNLKHQIHPTSTSYRKVMPKRTSGFLNITKLIWVSGILLRGVQVNGVASLELPHSLLTTTLPYARTIQCLTAPSSVHRLLAISMPCFLGCQLYHPMSGVVLRFTTLGEAADRPKGQTVMILNLRLDFLDHLHTQNLR